MNSTNIDSITYNGGNSSKRAVGSIVVIGVHLVVGWALVTGTARKGLDFIKKPLEAAVIQEVIIPPPPPPPPKKIEKLPETPTVAAPPPPFVPPPEVTPPNTSAPAIESVQTPPPTPAVIAPPPAPAPPPAAPVRANIKVACPTQVRPEMPSRAAKEGIEGIVKAQVLIRNGAVVRVDILSGPEVFRAAVRDAMMQYRCVTGTGDIISTQDIAFEMQ